MVDINKWLDKAWLILSIVYLASSIFCSPTDILKGEELSQLCNKYFQSYKSKINSLVAPQKGANRLNNALNPYISIRENLLDVDSDFEILSFSDT